MTDLAAIDAALAGTDLITRGGFHPAAEDGLPTDGRTLVMIGNAGPAMWQCFQAQRRAEADPLDGWTRRVVAPIADRFGAEALYPFDGPPYLPFQRWAQQADAVYPSPLGPLIHPEFGLWHAYRAALLFTEMLGLPPRDRRPSPCVSCTARPCLERCPVGAVSDGALDVGRCTDHLGTEAGDACFAAACLARRACPVGDRYRYEPDQARFHMSAFVGRCAAD